MVSNNINLFFVDQLGRIAPEHFDSSPSLNVIYFYASPRAGRRGHEDLFLLID